MFHANTQRLIEEWRDLKGPRVAPARSDITPAGFREMLPQLFILGHEGSGPDAFRLAGGLLVDLHDRDLRGVPFLSLWPYPDRAVVAEALDQARATGVPAVLEASAWTAGGYEARMEIVLAPLVGPSGLIDRVLGLYQPTAGLRCLLGQPVRELTLHNVAQGDRPTTAWSRPRPPLRLAALDGERLP